MLAHEVVEGMCHTVLVRTCVAKRAMPFSECFAEWSIGVKTEPILPSEEVGKGKIEPGWRL